MSYKHSDTYQMIASRDELTKSLNILTEKHHEIVELRYPAFTFNDGLESVIAVIPHQFREYTFLVPYFRSKSHIQGPREDKGTLEEIVAKGLPRETELCMNHMEELGIIEVPNTIPDAIGPHKKHVVRITDYNKCENKKLYMPTEKTGKGMWVRNRLLTSIFEKNTIVKNGLKEHPQLEAYRMASKNNGALLFM
jgi:hypothetical protein